MIESKPWNWTLVQNPIWKEPSFELYPIAFEWKKKKVGRVLDLGCGLGRNSIFLSQLGFDVDSFDLSQEALLELEKVARELNLTVRTIRGDMLSLPYDSNSFDYLVAFHVIYHTDRKGIEKVISEILRVLKLQGELFVTFNSDRSPQLTDKRFKRIDKKTIVKTEGEEAGVPHYYVDEDELLMLLKDVKIKRLFYQEEIGESYRSCHYFVHGVNCKAG